MKHALCLLALLATACTATLSSKPVPPQPPAQRAQYAALVQEASISVACADGDDCNSKWKRAGQWVAQNSVYRTNTSTDSEIRTDGPLEPTTDSAFTITKTEATGGASVIYFSSTCGKTTPCVPSALELKASFKRYVLKGF